MHAATPELVSSRALIPLLKSCAKRKDLDTGLKLHANAVAQDLLRKDPFVANTLIDMYAKCGSLTKAQEVFDGLESRDVVSWTAIIGGFAEHGLGKEALNCLDLMQFRGLFPNAITLVCSLKACGSLKALDKGQELHAEAERKGLLEQDIVIGNTLVDMYAKCGALERANEVCKKLFIRDVISWTALIAGYVEHDRAEEAFKCFYRMQIEGVAPNALTFSSILKVCAIIGDIDKGKEIHAQIEPVNDLGRDKVLANTLVDMYAKCGLLSAAYSCFSKLPSQTIVGWTVLMSAYADFGHDESAIQCFESMQAEGIMPDCMSLACCLKACANSRNLSKGQVLHAEIERIGFLAKDAFIGVTLVNLYAKCGSLSKAKEVFDKLQVQGVAAWTVLMAAYIDHTYNEEGLICYDSMQFRGLLPSSVTFSHSLKACSNLRETDKGIQMHADIEKLGFFEGDVVVGNPLIEMYMQVGLVSEGCHVFDKLLFRNVASWNIIIAGLIGNEQNNDVSNFLELMQLEGVSPDCFTYVCSLRFFGGMGAIGNVEAIHSDIEKRGLMETDLVLGNALVDGYARCGLLSTGQTIFMRLPSKDTVLWNTLILNYTDYSLGEEVLQSLVQMECMDIPPDSLTLLCGLKACVQVGDIRRGQELHAEIERQDLSQELVVGNTLIDMYAKFGLLATASEVFLGLPQKDIISWTAMIAGYAENGHGQEAFVVAEQMQCCGMDPNDVTYMCLLRACVNEELFDKGQAVHCEIERKGFVQKNIALSNALIDFYAKNGLIRRAEEVFNRLPVKNALSWSTLIAGYVENGHSTNALRLFECMQLQKLSADAHIFTTCLMACGMSGDIEIGQHIHSDVEKRAFLDEIDFIGNTLVDMYAKCDALVSAQHVFDKLSTPDIVAWNALVTGYAMHGEGESAINCLEQMLVEGVIPNDITFIGILKACSAVGLLEKGQDVHSLLARSGWFARNIVLGNSLLTMYAKCGMLKKVKEVFDCISAKNVVSWTALITGYTEHDFVEEALECYEQMNCKNISPNFVTYISVLKACGSIGAVEKGRQVHSEIEKKGLGEGDIVRNTLVHMYSKCGSVTDALPVFDKAPVGNEVLWNALIAGYSKLGEGTVVLKLFNRMLQTGSRPSTVTFTIVFTACSRSCLLECCLSYCEVMAKEHGVDLSLKHIPSIVGLLYRVGHIENALALTTKMPFLPNIAVWRSMLHACRDSGNLQWGRQIGNQALCLARKDPSAYILLSHIFAGVN